LIFVRSILFIISLYLNKFAKNRNNEGIS